MIAADGPVDDDDAVLAAMAVRVGADYTRGVTTCSLTPCMLKLLLLRLYLVVKRGLNCCCLCEIDASVDWGYWKRYRDEEINPKRVDVDLVLCVSKYTLAPGEKLSHFCVVC